MLDRIRNLSQFMKDKKLANEKLVLMLGAGGSISAGVKPTETIIRELVENNAKGTNGNLDDRFNQLWRGASDAQRARMLEPYLNQRPSPGYQKLAELVQLDFVDTVITFNFDRLLELALNEAGFTDYRTLIVGETAPEAIRRIVEARRPRLKILKMHGSLESVLLLFTQEEMLNYPPDLAALIDELTGRDIVICGYAFSDTCVIRAFNASKNGGAIYFVNPAGAAPNIKGFLVARRSLDKVIEGDVYGRFDEFFTALHGELTSAGTRVAAPRKNNPFKFLDHYQEDQRAWFLGRRSVTRRIVNRLESDRQPVLYLTGKPKVGKTSLIRAGLIPYLAEKGRECIYVRCKGDLNAQMRGILQQHIRQSESGDVDWATFFKQLMDEREKPLVMFFDQFERPCRAAVDAPDRTSNLIELMTAIAGAAPGRLTGVFCAPSDDLAFLQFAMNAPRFAQVKVDPLPSKRVRSIIRHAARRGGITLDSGTVAKLAAEYEETLQGPKDRLPFTLQHVQTICYYLARGLQPPYTGYRELPQGALLAALDSLKEETSLIDLLDDLPPAERRMIRSFLKVICDPSTNTAKVIGLIRQHFSDIMEERFPEPIA